MDDPSTYEYDAVFVLSNDYEYVTTTDEHYVITELGLIKYFIKILRLKIQEYISQKTRINEY